MKPAFHGDATLAGYIAEGLIAGSIQGLLDWNHNKGTTKDMEARIVSKVFHLHG